MREARAHNSGTPDPARLHGGQLRPTGAGVGKGARGHALNAHKAGYSQLRSVRNTVPLNRATNSPSGRAIVTR
jgi:hypothetical protein